MLKFLKLPILLTIIFYALYHFNIVKGLPSFIVPEGFPSAVLERIPKISSSNEPQQLVTADLVEKIQKNDLKDIQNIWRQLGIKSELFKMGAPILAESFPLSLPSPSASYHVFILTNNETHEWQYLLFNIKNRSWNLYGQIDLPNQDLTEPISRPVSIEGRTWLVITSKADSPDLPEMYQDLWYDLTGPKLKEVLRYYVYQDQTISGFTKRYSATIIETGLSGGTYFIDLNTKLAFLDDPVSDPHPDPAFSYSRKIRYLWDNAGQSFKNHHPQSEHLYTYQADEILVHNYLQIEDLAANGNPAQHSLVKRFLNLCNNSNEQRRILKILR